MEIQPIPQEIGGTQMERIKEEWKSFQALPFRKKLEHIWIYYKWYILVAAAVICVLVSILGTVANNQKETLISGIFINNSTSSQGYTHLKEGYWEYCGGNQDQKVELITGRTHQIRVHMAYIGHPILGDTVYGHKNKELGQDSQCLHAGALCFRHPKDGRPVMVFAPLPEYFTQVLEQLRKRQA